VIDVPLSDWLLISALAAMWTMVRSWRTGAGVGIVFTYVVSFLALYWLAPAMYLLPWYDNPGYDLTALGLREAAIGMAAFMVGTEVARPIASRRAARLPPVAGPQPIDQRLVNLFLVTGAGLYLIVFPLAGALPSVTALVATGSTIAVVGIGLKCWTAWHQGRELTMWLWIASTCVLPLITVLGQGFLGYGFAAMMTVFALVASFYRPRYSVIVAGALLTFLGLSVYVTYMRDRRDIRAIVWTGGDINERVDQIADTFTGMEWFDPRNIDHLDRVDRRLNQDYLVGAAVAYLAGGSAEFAHGTTVWHAVIAVIPRALWPNKPVVAGSGDLVADFTGFRFAEGTSVGIGQVMEAYVNFGRSGIVVCFLVIGFALALADSAAYGRLVRGQASEFLVRYLPALSVLQVGGSFAEVTSSAGAGLIMALLLRRAAGNLSNRRAISRDDGERGETVGRVARREAP
jgi:hypothetical protein